MLQNKISAPQPQPKNWHPPRLPGGYTRDSALPPHRPSAPHRPRSSAITTVYFANRSEAMSIFRDAMCGDKDSLKLAHAIAAVTHRIADRRLPPTLCACCPREFNRDELPEMFAIATTDERMIAAGVCDGCAALPFDEMKARFIANLRVDLKDSEMRELPTEHFMDEPEGAQ